jgi:predicted O-linked N-acetylglucosamine transferase (SPINDLY family)
MAVSDVSIDTLYYGGANTSYDAFAAGTPVVALPGRFQRGKYTEATYRMMEMTDCLVDSNETYVEKCVQLAHDRAYREHIKSRILERCPVLFEDDQVVTDHLEFFRRAIVDARA